MKRLVPLSLLLVLLAGVSIISSPAATNGQSAGLVSSVLNRMERNRQSLRSLKASLTMEKYNAQLRDKDNYTGWVLYVPGSGRDASVRIEWQKPQHEILAVSKGQYQLFRPRLNQVMVGKSGSVKGGAGASGVLDMMNMSKAQLEAKFQPVQDVREETLWGGVGTIHLTLVPKGNANFKYAEIWVDSAGMPVQTKIVEKNGDATTMRLSGMERNLKISSEEFSLKLDSSVKVVKG
ncbi:MAG: Outer rane lipoprotein carrier protein LolA [Pyrinomonadaceae bacterium]|jgi:outer membrane lipoprotein-sorting protein|nr:Outer rane lipoprotein carrier protein LolA [Pyrinomonadaceae bacterium]MDQ1728729.1 Outer rane lipoprotein carrier protein LolA [Pyrinomonadaceae bacterium]